LVLFGVVLELLHQRGCYSLLPILLLCDDVFDIEDFVMASHVLDCLSCHVTNDYAVFLSDEAASCIEVEVEAGRSHFSRVLFLFLIQQRVVLPEVF